MSEALHATRWAGKGLEMGRRSGASHALWWDESGSVTPAIVTLVSSCPACRDWQVTLNYGEQPWSATCSVCGNTHHAGGSDAARSREAARALITGDWVAPAAPKLPRVQRAFMMSGAEAPWPWMWRRASDSSARLYLWMSNTGERGTPPRFRRLDSSCSAALILCIGLWDCKRPGFPP